MRVTYSAGMYDNEHDRQAAQLLLLSHGFVLADLDAWLQVEGITDEVRRYYQQHREALVQAAIDGNTGAAAAGVAHLRLVLFADKREQFLVPLATHGKTMRKGRKVGTVGPVRAWLRKYMTKHPEATAAEAWAAIAKRPPKECTAHDNLLGKYIEDVGNKSTSYRQFANLVSLERPKK